MRNPKQPRRKPAWIVQLPQTPVGFEECILGDVHRILAIPRQPENVIEDTALPAGHQQVVGVHITPAGFGHQVPVFDFAKDQSGFCFLFTACSGQPIQRLS